MSALKNYTLRMDEEHKIKGVKQLEIKKGESASFALI